MEPGGGAPTPAARGRPPGGEADRALRDLHALSWNADPWLVLEVAWRELPPPVTDEIRVGLDDYGAVRGFFHPRGGDPALSRHRLEWTKYEHLGGPLPPPGHHRWTRHEAWLRLRPATPAPGYDLTLWMGAPFPSTLSEPEVTVTADGVSRTFRLGPSVAPYTLRVPAPAPDQPLEVRIDSPTWTRIGEPAAQGVRVDRLTVASAP